MYVYVYMTSIGLKLYITHLFGERYFQIYLKFVRQKPRKNLDQMELYFFFFSIVHR